MKRPYTIKPIYTHDCDCCKFLGGTIWGQQYIEYYQCGDTAIARMSSEPSDNLSRPIALFSTQAKLVGGSSVWIPAKELLAIKK